MKIEHIAYQVDDPQAVASWYVAHLGFTLKRAQSESPFMHFIADESGQVMLELYNNPAVTTPDYAGMHPLLLHTAFCCEDVKGTVARLTDAGATLASGPELTPAGDTLAMLRDPWSHCIQLCQRKEPMIAS